jgi:hypothetical protein
MAKEEKADDVKKESTDSKSTTRNVNYIHYDPGSSKKKSSTKQKRSSKSRLSTELHWCKSCNVFPKTAKDFLNHLHSETHQVNAKNTDNPWREKMLAEEAVTIPGAPTKRTPIRGLQFFVPATSWYCKICSFWMGDLHCASLHLKSAMHSDNYNGYMAKNPNFEIDWMSDRQKAYEKVQEKKGEDKQAATVPAPQIELNLPTQGLGNKSTFENIPLQIQDDKKAKKRKSKKDEKKEKKKKKRSKKKKRVILLYNKFQNYIVV